MPISFLCKVIVIIWNYKQELIAKFSLLSINEKSFGKSITGKRRKYILILVD